MYIEVYKLNPAYFITAPGLAWQAALKKIKIKFLSINWYQYVTNGRKRY